MRAKKLHFSVLYERLRASFGHQNWWPGETRDEIMIGAILTQQSTWTNVEKAIANLRRHKLLNLKRISGVDKARLQRLIYSTGFYRQKADRLRGFAYYVFSNYGSIDQMFSQRKEELRNELLSINGIGKETADSIMLYAANKNVFVIDAYTKRIMSRIYGFDEDIDYDKLQSIITSSIKPDVELYKDFHAQFVELGKNYCKPRPICSGCPVRENCSYGSANGKGA
jgi:endonuclease III related protein